ncbi:universal stress protein [Arcobacter aquimarinus]|uniref:universal stress protein n=1 Tax=Arcobacter aquimarinus TaxID=1315211 RepID=UPI003BB03E39
MNKSRLLVLNDLREFTSTIAKKSMFLANKYNKELDVLHIEDESFLRFFKEKTECSLERSKEILKEYYENNANIYCKCGNFIEIIKEHISKNNISTVIVGFKRERTFFEDIFNGSNLNSIIRKVDLPVLVIKTEDTPNYKNILIPTDLSKSSKKNIEYLVNLFPEANFHIEHYYKTFFEDRIKLYGFDDDEVHDFVDFYATEAELELNKFVESLNIPQEIKIFKKAKKFIDIKSMVDESIEYKTIDLLSLSVSSSFSIFSFDLLEHSTKDVIIYKILED